MVHYSQYYACLIASAPKTIIIDESKVYTQMCGFELMEVSESMESMEGHKESIEHSVTNEHHHMLLAKRQSPARYLLALSSPHPSPALSDDSTFCPH